LRELTTFTAEVAQCRAGVTLGPGRVDIWFATTRSTRSVRASPRQSDPGKPYPIAILLSIEFNAAVVRRVHDHAPLVVIAEAA